MIGRRGILGGLLSMVTPGGIPPRRPDQYVVASEAVSPATQGGTTIASRLFAGQTMVVNSGGIFVYNGAPAKGSLVFALTLSSAPATDPYGNALFPGPPGFNFGHWTAAGAIAQHFGIDNSGNLYIVDPNDVTRIFFSNNPPTQRFLNAFGATVTYFDGTNSAIFQYLDTGSATQGALRFAQVAKACTDPVTGVVFAQPGLYLYSSGSAVVGNQAGLFVYNTNPALGQLVASMTPATTVSDGLGNTVLPGITNYFNTGAVFLAVQELSGNISFQSAPSAGGAYTLLGQVQSTSNGMTISQNNGQIAVASQGGLSPATLFLGTNGVEGLLNSGFRANVVLSQTDTTVIPATTTALTRISKQYTILAGDPTTTVIYRFRFKATGVQGTTANAFSYSITLGGTTIFSESITAAALPANHAFTIWIDADIWFTAVGAGGNASVVVLRSVADATSGGNAANTNPVADLAGNPVNTTVNNALQFNFQWGSVTGAPTVSGRSSSFERVGS